MTLIGYRAGSRKEVPITLTVKAKCLTYGPLIEWSATTDIPCERGWSWDDHPLLHCRALREASPTSVTSCGEIVDDTPAVRALLTELCEGEGKKLLTSTHTTHKGRLIAALELMWA